MKIIRIGLCVGLLIPFLTNTASKKAGKSSWRREKQPTFKDSLEGKQPITSQQLATQDHIVIVVTDEDQTDFNFLNIPSVAPSETPITPKRKESLSMMEHNDYELQPEWPSLLDSIEQQSPQPTSKKYCYKKHTASEDTAPYTGEEYLGKNTTRFDSNTNQKIQEQAIASLVIHGKLLETLNPNESLTINQALRNFSSESSDTILTPPTLSFEPTDNPNIIDLSIIKKLDDEDKAYIERCYNILNGNPTDQNDLQLKKSPITTLSIKVFTVLSSEKENRNGIEHTYTANGDTTLNIPSTTTLQFPLYPAPKKITPEIVRCLEIIRGNQDDVKTLLEKEQGAQSWVSFLASPLFSLLPGPLKSSYATRAHKQALQGESLTGTLAQQKGRLLHNQAYIHRRNEFNRFSTALLATLHNA